MFQCHMHEVVSCPVSYPWVACSSAQTQSRVPTAVPRASRGCISTLEHAQLRQSPLGIELLDKISIKDAQLRFSETPNLFEAIDFFHKGTKRQISDLAVSLELTISQIFFPQNHYGISYIKRYFRRNPQNIFPS